jgi:outer membrane protein assembly factor BamB
MASRAAFSDRPPSQANARSVSRDTRISAPQWRRLLVEPLEDRRMLSLGDLLHTLDDPDVSPQSGAGFGAAVAADGPLMVVGEPYAPDGGYPSAGRAYVFDSATGALLAALRNPTPATGDCFGFSVAVSGSTVVVGAYQDDTGATNTGSAYVFDAATGNLLWTLNNPRPVNYGYFGNSVAVSGSTVVVGAYKNLTGASYAGSAYVFDAATGSLLWTLNNPTPAASDCFGNSVAVSGSAVVVGAPDDDTGATDAGSA